MISGDRSLVSGKHGAFSDMLGECAKHWERIDIVCPSAPTPALTPSPSPDGRGETFFPANVFLHSSSRGLWYQPFWIKKKGAELVRQFHHDVMTVHEYPPFYNGIGARLLKRVVEIPAVLEIHHIVGWPRASSISEWIGRWMTNIFIGSHANQFDAVRVVNGTVKSMLTLWGVEEKKISVVPSVYLDHAALNITKNQMKKFDIVFAARLVDNKGLLETIDAVASLPNVTMLVIGDGPLRTAMEEKVRHLAISDRVTFTGWLPSALDVARSIASGRIFVMNSRSEGNPRSLIEAMALGVPCITTKVGIAPDVIREGVNGVFTTGEAADLAEKIRALLSSPEQQTSLGREAIQITERFERGRLITAYADFLKSLSC